MLQRQDLQRERGRHRQRETRAPRERGRVKAASSAARGSHSTPVSSAHSARGLRGFDARVPRPRRSTSSERASRDQRSSARSAEVSRPGAGRGGRRSQPRSTSRAKRARAARGTRAGSSLGGTRPESNGYDDQARLPVAHARQHVPGHGQDLTPRTRARADEAVERRESERQAALALDEERDARIRGGGGSPRDRRGIRARREVADRVACARAPPAVSGGDALRESSPSGRAPGDTAARRSRGRWKPARRKRPRSRSIRSPARTEQAGARPARALGRGSSARARVRRSGFEALGRAQERRPRRPSRLESSAWRTWWSTTGESSRRSSIRTAMRWRRRPRSARGARMPLALRRVGFGGAGGGLYGRAGGPDRSTPVCSDYASPDSLGRVSPRTRAMVAHRSRAWFPRLRSPNAASTLVRLKMAPATRRRWARRPGTPAADSPPLTTSGESARGSMRKPAASHPPRVVVTHALRTPIREFLGGLLRSSPRPISVRLGAGRGLLRKAAFAPGSSARSISGTRAGGWGPERRSSDRRPSGHSRLGRRHDHEHGLRLGPRGPGTGSRLPPLWDALAPPWSGGVESMSGLPISCPHCGAGLPPGPRRSGGRDDTRMGSTARWRTC
jgi:hypothetical protein